MRTVTPIDAKTLIDAVAEYHTGRAAALNERQASALLRGMFRAYDAADVASAVGTAYEFRPRTKPDWNDVLNVLRQRAARRRRDVSEIREDEQDAEIDILRAAAGRGCRWAAELADAIRAKECDPVTARRWNEAARMWSDWAYYHPRIVKFDHSWKAEISDSPARQWPNDHDARKVRAVATLETERRVRNLRTYGPRMSAQRDRWLELMAGELAISRMLDLGDAQDAGDSCGTAAPLDARHQGPLPIPVEPEHAPEGRETRNPGMSESGGSSSPGDCPF